MKLGPTVPEIAPGRTTADALLTAHWSRSASSRKKLIEVFIDRVSTSAVAEKSEKSPQYLSNPLVMHVDANRQRLGSVKPCATSHAQWVSTGLPTDPSRMLTC